MISYIDSHAHAWSDLCQLVDGRRYTPNTTFPIAELVRQMSSGDVHKAVLVQPSFLGTNNSYMLNQLRRSPEAFRGIAAVDENIAKSELQEMMDMGVKGVRLNIFGKQISSDDFASSYGNTLELVKGLQGHVEIHSSGDQWLNIIPIVEEIGLPFVVDHFGRTEFPESAGFQEILNAMDTGTAWVKLSGWYRLNTAVEPFAKALLSVARERLVWGSDCPWTQHEQGRSYSECISRLEFWVGEENMEAILINNPSNLYAFDC